MKTLKKIIPPAMIVVVVLLLSSFNKPGSAKSSELIYAAGDTTYENVIKELEELESQIKSEMTEEEAFVWTPVAAITAAAVRAVQFTVAATRVTIALTRAATAHTPRITEVTRTVPTTQLLTITGIADNNSLKSNLTRHNEEYKKYKMSMLR